MVRDTRKFRVIRSEDGVPIEYVFEKIETTVAGE